MVDYLYDGTFEGLLTCIYHHYYTEKALGIFRREEYQSTMLGGFREVETEEEKAVTVYDAIERKVSAADLKRIYKVFCCDMEGKETKILNYVRLGFVKGACVSLLHGDPIVYPVQQAEHKINGEIHRLKGLIRFSELEDRVLYCKIEPDHDVVEFLAEHFTDRFKNEPFIIHDQKRKKALIAYQGHWYISDFTEKDVMPLSRQEEDYRRLWKSYFENMAIKERINPRCQKNMMPVRYWKHLTEFQP